MFLMERIKKIIKEEVERLFLLEERGVPKEVKKATFVIVDKIKREEQSVEKEDWVTRAIGNINYKKTTFTCRVKSEKDLFFKNLLLIVDCVKILDKNVNYNVLTNGNRAELYKNSIIFDAEKEKIKDLTIRLKLCYIDDVDNKLTYSLVSHELLHAFEFLKRKEVFTSQKHSLYNAINSDRGVYSKIKPLTFLFNTMCYFEINANIVGLYHELYKSNKNSLEGLKREYYDGGVYNEFFKYLEKPELILTNSLINSITKEELVGLNSDIDELNQKIGAKEKQEIKYIKSETVEQYFERIKIICKNSYNFLYKDVLDLIYKVVEDKKSSNKIEENWSKDNCHTIFD